MKIMGNRKIKVLILVKRKTGLINTTAIKKEIIKYATESKSLDSTGHSDLNQSTACSVVKSNESFYHLKDYNFVTHSLGKK